MNKNHSQISTPPTLRKTLPRSLPRPLRGCLTALITPFDEDDRIDEAVLERLVERQITAGIHGLVPCGTTGESPTLSHDEHKRVTELCVRTSRGRVPVIAGCGSNSTAESIDFVHHAEKAGADAALVIVPYYNKPGQEGIYRHFAAIAQSSDLPLILYNIPGRCIVGLEMETLKRLTDHPTIIGIKDATGDLSFPARTTETRGGDFCQLSGEDATAIAFLAEGGHGCISVSANLAPELCAQVQQAWIDGKIEQASALHRRLGFLHTSLFCETNPGPVKYAAHALGLCDNRLRLPMVPISRSSEKIIDQALHRLSLLPE